MTDENNENNIGAGEQGGFTPNTGEQLNDPQFGGFASGDEGAGEKGEENENSDGADKADESEFDDSESKPSVASGVVNSISKRLSDNAEGEKDANNNDDMPNEKDSIPFDLSKMTDEQLQLLKQRLNATPDRVMKKKGNPIVTMRRDENGRFIVKHKRCYQTMIMDEELQKKVAVQMIPVMFYGDTEFTDMRWDKFQELERVKCEVLKDLSEEKELEDGVTTDRDTGQEVVMTKTYVKHHFKVKLSETETADVDAEYVNA